jgi:hypothetical protein
MKIFDFSTKAFGKSSNEKLSNFLEPLILSSKKAVMMMMKNIKKIKAIVI